MARTKIPKDWKAHPDTLKNLREEFPEINTEDIQHEERQFKRWFLSSGKVIASAFDFQREIILNLVKSVGTKSLPKKLIKYDNQSSSYTD